MRRKQTVRRGFTLIELLVAIGVVIILVAILLPAVSAARRNAKRGATMSLIRDIDTALDHYGADFGFFPSDGNAGMKAGLEEPEYRNFSAKELVGAAVVDSFGRQIYFDNVFSSTGHVYTINGDDAAPAADPRAGNARNPDFDLWSLGHMEKDLVDNICNWRT